MRPDQSVPTACTAAPRALSRTYMCMLYAHTACPRACHHIRACATREMHAHSIRSRHVPTCIMLHICAWYRMHARANMRIAAVHLQRMRAQRKLEAGLARPIGKQLRVRT